jgi:hypothetical protein
MAISMRIARNLPPGHWLIMLMVLISMALATNDSLIHQLPQADTGAPIALGANVDGLKLFAIVFLEVGA